ncbi:MAG: porphobilinogen synthase, partial [Terriglobales bacterium]
MAFPVTRMRRLRRNEQIRSLVRETRLTAAGLVYPLFVCPGRGVRKEIGSMPGVFNLSVDQAVKEAREAHGLGIPAIILFGLPAKKDEVATGAWADDGIVQQAARAIKRELPGLLVIGDVCLCEYMSHGHCGVVRMTKKPATKGGKAAKTPLEYEILNDPTLEILAKTAVSLVRAGVDIV